MTEPIAICVTTGLDVSITLRADFWDGPGSPDATRRQAEQVCSVCQKLDRLKAIIAGQSLQEAVGSLQRAPDRVGAAPAVGQTALIASGNIHGVDIARPQAR